LSKKDDQKALVVVGIVALALLGFSAASSRGFKSKYFTLEDLTVSDTAESIGMLEQFETPDKQILENATFFARFTLDPLVEVLGYTPMVNSWYRIPALNAHPSVGGSSTSDHLDALGIDLDAASPIEIAEAVIQGDIPFSQLILENGTFENPAYIHLAYTGDDKRQILWNDGGTYYTVDAVDLMDGVPMDINLTAETTQTIKTVAFILGGAIVIHALSGRKKRRA